MNRKKRVAIEDEARLYLGGLISTLKLLDIIPRKFVKHYFWRLDWSKFRKGSMLTGRPNKRSKNE